MLNHAEIAGLIPHHGAMCLLDRVENWDETSILCRAVSHLAPGNPLRRAGRLGAICGFEYGFQAAALHGALVNNGVAQPAGYVAVLRVAHMARPYLDEPGFGLLRVQAELEAALQSGMMYRLRLLAKDGALILEGQGTISLPASLVRA